LLSLGQGAGQEQRNSDDRSSKYRLLEAHQRPRPLPHCKMIYLAEYKRGTAVPAESEAFTRRGILEGLIAAAVGGGLIPVVKACWEYFLPQRRFPAWAQGFATNVAGAVIVLALWALTRLPSRIAMRRSRATAAAKGDRLSIYVALFAGDDEH